MRRHAALLACLLTCACTQGDGRGPLTDSRTPPSLSPRFYPPPGWTFGLIRAGKAPAQRYGVSSPAGIFPRGAVLILPDYGESAEAWYETVRALNAQGWTVWVLERLAQGGSTRYASRRDLGHAVSLDPDIAAVSGLIAKVIRQPGGVFLLGQGEGALVGLRAAAGGAQVRGVVLTSPGLTSPAETRLQAHLRFFGLGGLRADRTAVWRGDGQDDAARRLTHDRVRGGVQMAWQRVNPDLRMGGPTLSRFAAVRILQRTLKPEALKAPVLVLENGPEGAELCRRMTQCEHRVLDGGADFYLETDPRRQAWLEAIEAFMADLAANGPMGPARPPAGSGRSSDRPG